MTNELSAESRIDYLFSNIDDDILRTIVVESKVLDETGVLADDTLLKDIATQMAVSLKIEYSEALMITLREVINRAAYKFAGI